IALCAAELSPICIWTYLNELGRFSGFKIFFSINLSLVSPPTVRDIVNKNIGHLSHFGKPLCLHDRFRDPLNHQFFPLCRKPIFGGVYMNNRHYFSSCPCSL